MTAIPLSKDRIKVILQAGVALAFAVGLVWFFANQQGSQNKSVENLQREIKREATQTWNNYESEEDGFEIKYPQQYELDTEFRREKFHSLFFSHQQNNTFPDLNFALIKDPNLPHRTLLESYRAQGVVELKTKIGDIDAREFRMARGTNFIAVFLPHKENTIILSITSSGIISRDHALLFDLFASSLEIN